MPVKRALITGITGQDGSYLAELLLSKGYEVHGMVRRVALEVPEHRFWRLGGVREHPALHLHAGSLESYASLCKLVDAVQPDECYHLAAQSYVSASFDDAFSTFHSNVDGTLHLLSALRERSPQTRLYFAATSEMFGKAPAPQNEETPFHPRSPYGVSKVAGYHLVHNFRESYGLFACSGILFNHESPRRGLEFVTRKITSAAARIHHGSTEKLRLGNLAALRDWGYAGDYVEAMWRMLQQPEPEEFVIATGNAHSVEDFLRLSFESIDKNWHDHVVLDPDLMRPADVAHLQGDASKAERMLGWKPTVQLPELVERMVSHDIIENRP